MDFDRATFFEAYAMQYGNLKANQRKGLAQVLDFLEQDPDITDVRWAAYLLATVKHECANRWQPIEEVGKGAGKPYGKPVTVVGADGQEYVNVYYGRGYVQLTWRDNYETMSQALSLDDDLLIHPKRALDPEISYRILSYGMRHGAFTGKKLSDYIHDTTCDYRNARRIVNGLDRANLIQGYAEHFETMLQVGLVA
jgi:putative chitinase